MIEKKETKWRMPIPAKVRLAVALRFLATGDSYRSLHFLFKISSSIIFKIVTEVCQAINIVFKEEIKVRKMRKLYLLNFSYNYSVNIQCVKYIFYKILIFW